MSNTAIIICSYNMVEWTDALVEHIQEMVKVPYELVVVDNGSDLVEPSKYTTFRIPKNIQMVPGFMSGVDYADSLDMQFDYYWLITTSCRFIETDMRDPLKLMLDVMENDPLTFLVHPALYIDYGAWKQIMQPMTDEPRRVFGIEGVCPLYRASMFNELGGWRRELTYGWGMGPEVDFLARSRGWHIYVHDGYVMEKQSEVGYHMDRMNLTNKDIGDSWLAGIHTYLTGQSREDWEYFGLFREDETHLVADQDVHLREVALGIWKVDTPKEICAYHQWHPAPKVVAGTSRKYSNPDQARLLVDAPFE